MEELREKGYLVLNSRNTMSSLQSTVLSILPEGYEFLNYKYTILGPALYTYHRDVTSSKSSFSTRHPTYTAIQYEYEGAFLSVSPGSHHEWKLNLPVTLKGKKNTVILFDCDLVHGGIDAPPNVARKAIQYKIAHKDDLDLLFEVQGITVTQKGHENHWFLKRVLSVASYLLTVPIQFLCRPLMQRLQTGILGRIQSLFPIYYYNNSTD
jgi:hypothetical protein